MSKKAKKISNYVIVSLVASLTLGGIFTVISMRTFAKVNVMVAARDIEPYSGVITAEDFKMIEISKGDVGNFAGFVFNPNELIGKVSTTAVFAGQPVKAIQFVDPQDATGLQNVVLDSENRGLYLPLSASNALSGDMKIGGVYDIYVIVQKPNPTISDPEATETTVVPLQYSYNVNKLIRNEDGSVNLFMEFPEKESERYVMLKHMISNGKATLMATMPNAIHEEYTGKILGYNEFFGALVSNKNYFTSISKDKDSEADISISTSNPLENNVEITE